MNTKKIIYRTPTRNLRAGFVIVRDDNRRVKITKVFDCLTGHYFVRDDSGTPGDLYPADALWIVESDN